MPYDPLDGIENRDINTQVALLIAESRGQRNALGEVKAEVRYMKHALWGLSFTLIGGVVMFLFSIAAGWVGSGQ